MIENHTNLETNVRILDAKKNKTSNKDIINWDKIGNNSVFDDPSVSNVPKDDEITDNFNGKTTTEINTDKGDNADDGKISFGEKAGHFIKGVFSPITSMFESPGNFLKGAAMIVGCGALCAVTGGAVAPLLVAGGAIMGGVQVIKGAEKAGNAKTDDEAKVAWEEIGAGSGVVAASVLGAKSAAKAGGIELAEGTGHIGATVKCITHAPSSAIKSVSAIGSKISGAFSGGAAAKTASKGATATASEATGTAGEAAATASKPTATKPTATAEGAPATASETTGTTSEGAPATASETTGTTSEGTPAATTGTAGKAAETGTTKAKLPYEKPKFVIKKSPEYKLPYEDIISNNKPEILIEPKEVNSIPNNINNTDIAGYLPEHATATGVETKAPNARQLKARAKLDKAAEGVKADGSVIELGDGKPSLSTRGGGKTKITQMEDSGIPGISIDENGVVHIDGKTHYDWVGREYYGKNGTLNDITATKAAPETVTDSNVVATADSTAQTGSASQNAATDTQIGATSKPKKGLFNRIKDWFTGKKAAKQSKQTEVTGQDFFKGSEDVNTFKANGGTFKNGKAYNANGEEFTGTITKTKADGNIVKINYQDGTMESSTLYGSEYDAISSKNYSYSTNGDHYATSRNTNIENVNYQTGEKTSVSLEKMQHNVGKKNYELRISRTNSEGITRNTDYAFDNNPNGGRTLRQISEYGPRDYSANTYFDENGVIESKTETIQRNSDSGRISRKINTNYSGGKKSRQTREIKFLKYKNGKLDNVTIAGKTKLYKDGTPIVNTKYQWITE